MTKAAAVCQYWRTTLLSFPRLWNRVHSSEQGLFEVYLERSKYVPLQVHLHDLYDDLFDSLVPHISRLASLSVRMRDSSDFHLIAHHLPPPIPTLREFSITANGEEDVLEVPSDIDNGYFSHVKKLHLKEMPSFRAPHAFPHVTELVWVVDSRNEISIAGLLDTMGQLTELERVEIMFRRPPRHPNTEPVPHVVTLPHLQRMSLRLRYWSGGFSHILEFLRLQNLTSLDVDMGWRSSRPSSILPVTSFDEKLPNFSEPTEIEVHAHGRPHRVIFRSPQAVLQYQSIGRILGEQPYHHDRKLLGGPPLGSVRKLIVVLDESAYGPEVAWVVCLMRELESLEDLEIRGQCGCLLRYLRRMMMREYPLPHIKTLAVHSGGTGIRQALRLEEVMDGLGLGTIVTCTPDPRVPDDDDWNADGSSEHWNWIEDWGGNGDQD